MPIAAAAMNLAALPGNLHHFGRGAAGCGIGVRAQVAHAAMDMQHAVGIHSQQAVVAAAAGTVIADADSQAAHLAAVAFGLLEPFAPVEQTLALVDGFAHERAGHRTLTAALEAVAVECIDLAEFNPGPRRRRTPPCR